MKKAFTLVEILVVIAIIGVLAAVAINIGGNALKKTRDAKRKNDLLLVKKAMEQARMNCKAKYFYPWGDDNISHTLGYPHYNNLIQHLVESKYLATPVWDPQEKQDSDYTQYANATHKKYHYFDGDSSVSESSVCPSATNSNFTRGGVFPYYWVLRAPLEMGNSDPDASASYTKCLNSINNVNNTTAFFTATANDGYFYACTD